MLTFVERHKAISRDVFEELWCFGFFFGGLPSLGNLNLAEHLIEDLGDILYGFLITNNRGEFLDANTLLIGQRNPQEGSLKHKMLLGKRKEDKHSKD